jgi:hypothetical protein
MKELDAVAEADELALASPSPFSSETAPSGRLRVLAGALRSTLCRLQRPTGRTPSCTQRQQTLIKSANGSPAESGGIGRMESVQDTRFGDAQHQGRRMASRQIKD